MSVNFNYSDYIPQRVGLLYQPPQIIIEYLVPSTQKLYHHKIKLNRLSEGSDIDDMVRYVGKRHALWINGRLTEDQLETLIQRLQQGLKNRKQQQPQLAKTNTHIKVEVFTKPELPKPIKKEPEHHLTKSNNFTVSQFSSSMNSLTGKSKSKLEELGFEDIELDDEPQLSNYSEDYEQDFEEESVANSQISENINEKDLNKLTPEEVLKYKQKMDVVFNKNITKPGDPGYVYDKQVVFKGNKKSDWDDDD